MAEQQQKRKPDLSPTGLPSWTNISYHVSNGIGRFFYKLGRLVAENPWRTILFSWLIVGLCSLGLLKFQNEKNPIKLWVPEGSSFLRDTEWIMDSYQEGYRTQAILITAPNVLEPRVLVKLLKIHAKIVNFRALKANGTRLSLKDICFKIPIIASLRQEVPFRRRRRSATTFDDDFFAENQQTSEIEAKRTRPFSPSVDLDPSLFCGMIEQLDQDCLLESLLELWNFDETELNGTSLNEVVVRLNSTTISPYSGHDSDFVHLLGGIERDETGRIVRAESLYSSYRLWVNYSHYDSKKVGNMMGTEDFASEDVMDWEKEFIIQVAKLKAELDDDNFTIYYSAGRSYGDISNDVMFRDMNKMGLGMFLMFLYMQAVLSRFSWVELRIQLVSIGLTSVGMSFLSGCGICSILGVSYGPVHTSLPFLLMGLGVDDMFVVMACWRKIQATHSGKSLTEMMGLALQHAGASITVTSVTDIMAFLVGASTILPSLQSFCLYAAVSIFMMYFFVITFFIAVFTLDERRIAARRNAFAPCVQHTEEGAKIWMEKNLMHNFLRWFYSKFVLTKAGKIIIIMSVICSTGINIESLLQLRQKFDPAWFIPEGTYLNLFTTQTRKFYPELGSQAAVYLGRINYTQEMHKILELNEKLENRSDILHVVNSWPRNFADFVETYHEKDINSEDLTDHEWRKYLSQFLFSSSGGKFQSSFRFDRKLSCGEPTPNVTISAISFKFKQFDDREVYLPAKYAIEDLVKDENFNTGDRVSTVWGKIFANWITDEIIDEEIFRNLGLALAGVMACTMLIIINIQVCFWIFVTILLTLINVGGFMHRIGLTLDIVSCIALQLSVGLCVDYASHIGHTFLTINEGTRNERALSTVLHIGAAVLYGGGSTILALAMLATSQAYTYRTFFKIFLLVILYGLFHGVVLLPVILSTVGPSGYAAHRAAEAINRHDDPVEMISFIRQPSSHKKTLSNGSASGFVAVDLKRSLPEEDA